MERSPSTDRKSPGGPGTSHELREAATAARARRIEELTKRVSEHSEAAAAAIGDLVRHFRYDLILDALQGVADG